MDTIHTLQDVREALDGMRQADPHHAWQTVANLYGTASPLGAYEAHSRLNNLADDANTESENAIYRYAANLINDTCEAIDGQPLRVVALEDDAEHGHTDAPNIVKPTPCAACGHPKNGTCPHDRTTCITCCPHNHA